MKKRMKRAGRASVAAAVAVLGMSVLAAAPAHASGESDGTTTETCWFNSDTGVTQCFDDQAAFEAAVEAQTDGVLLLAGEVAPSARSAVEPRATYVLAVFYADSNKSGASVNITTSISTMCTTHAFTGNSMPSGWNDRVSSFASYGTCKTRLWENINLGGSSYGPVASTNSLGIMNDAASSYWIGS